MSLGNPLVLLFLVAFVYSKTSQNSQTSDTQRLSRSEQAPVEVLAGDARYFTVFRRGMGWTVTGG